MSILSNFHWLQWELTVSFFPSKVYTKGIHLFDEVAKFMQEIASRFSGSSVNLNGASKEFSDIEEMLKQERNQFEVRSELNTCFWNLS